MSMMTVLEYYDGMMVSFWESAHSPHAFSLRRSNSIHPFSSIHLTLFLRQHHDDNIRTQTQPLPAFCFTSLLTNSFKMTIFAKVAEVGHKGAVLGLMSLLGYQIYQIGEKVTEKAQSKYHHTEMFEKINDKVKEEGRKEKDFTNIPDRYEADDNSYLKKVPNLNELKRN